MKIGYLGNQHGVGYGFARALQVDITASLYCGFVKLFIPYEQMYNNRQPKGKKIGRAAVRDEPTSAKGGTAQRPRDPARHEGINDFPPSQSRESGLAVRAAWLYYVYRLTQAEVAEHLGLSRVKVHRLIALAHSENSVKVFVEGGAAECIALEQALKDRYGLSYASVVPSLGIDAAPNSAFRSLGTAAAWFLHQHLEQHPKWAFGVGHGRTLAAVADALPKLARPQASFVSILGSLTRRSTANPFDVIYRFAERTGGIGYFMPAPFFVDSVDDAAVLRGQRMVEDVLARARKTDLVLLGIGNLRNTPAIYTAERKSLAGLGVVAELLGQFLDREGHEVDCDMAERSISLRLHELRGKRVIGVAGGADKTEAIGATLASGLLSGVVTDEATAQAVLGAHGRPEVLRAGGRKGSAHLR